jgi:hypothetical protein
MSLAERWFFVGPAFLLTACGRSIAGLTARYQEEWGQVCIALDRQKCGAPSG